MYTLHKPSSSSKRQPIFIVKICINFVNPSGDATIALDGAFFLHVSNITRLPLRLCCAKPPNLVLFNAQEITPLLQETNRWSHLTDAHLQK
jgi:hypothetical protein